MGGGLWMGLGLSLLCPAWLSAEPSQVWYVDARAAGACDGTCWCDAFVDLQDALRAAHQAGGGDIWVTGGTYRPTRSGGGRAATFAIRNAISIYGGFQGTETSRDQRASEAEPTVLSGDLRGDDGSGGNRGDNCYHVLVLSNSACTTVLDRLVITGGNADGEGWLGYGGGMYSNGGAFVLNECRVVGNGALAGGGICCAYGGDATISRCTFLDNSAEMGGAVACFYSSPSLSQCTIENNTAVRHGGGIFGYAGSPVIDDCAIHANVAANGGGVFGIHEGGHVRLTGCSITGNTASFGCGGGAGCADGAGMWVDRCIVSGNSAYVGGGLALVAAGGGSAVVNSVVSGNAAADGRGGGIGCIVSELSVRGCTITDNRAGSGGGGVLVTLTSEVSMANCIVWNNHAKLAAGAGGQIEVGLQSGATVDFSDVMGGQGGIRVEGNGELEWGGGNMDAAPEFRYEQVGTWTDGGSYDPATRQVTLTDTSVSWVDGALAGMLISPDASQGLQHVIVANSVNTVTVQADRPTIVAGVSQVASGMAYRVFDYRLQPRSPCVDVGDNEAAVLFEDATTGPGEPASLAVSDPGAYEIGDRIEYDPLMDGEVVALRSIVEIRTEEQIVICEPPLSGPSEAVKTILNFGGGDIDGDDRVFDGNGDGRAIVDLGADESHELPQEAIACCLAGGACEYVPPGDCDERGGVRVPDGQCLGDADEDGIDDACQGQDDRPRIVQARSRKRHGSAGDFDIDLPQAGLDGQASPFPGIECRLGGPDTIIVTFSEPVVAADGTLDETEVALSVGTFVGISADGAEITLRIADVPDGTCALITFSGLVDVEGSPVVTGHDHVFFGTLVGDITGDGAVDIGDFTGVKGQRFKHADQGSFRSDVDTDGAIDVSDLTLVTKVQRFHMLRCP